jgi:organic radical activating enzyme
VPEIVDRLANLDPRLLIVTGGEPLLQERGLIPIFEALKEHHGFRIHIETNGTKLPAPALERHVDWWVVSPKLANSGNEDTARIRPDALVHFASLARNGRGCWKFVATGPEDFSELDGLVAEFALPPRTVWIMPEGNSAPALLAHAMELVAPTAERAYNLTLRQHVLLYGEDRRGT